MDEFGAVGEDNSERSNMDEMRAVGGDHLVRPLMAPNIRNESEGSYQEEWVDIKQFKNLTLKEIKSFPSNDCSSDDKKAYVPVTKVVVRRLPPRFTIKEYLSQLPEVPEYNYIRKASPIQDLPSSIEERTAIYINFEKEKEAIWFKEKYNNMEFFDDKGNCYISCIDYDFVQGVLKDPPAEPEMGILEESEMYRRFLKIYEEDPLSLTMTRPTEIWTPEPRNYEIKKTKPLKLPASTSTPLSEFLRQQANMKAEREERERKIQEYRRQQKEEMLMRQKEEEEEAKRYQKLLKQKNRSQVTDGGQYHQNGGGDRSSAPLKWPPELDKGFKLIAAECKRSQERMDRLNNWKKSKEKLDTEKRINNNAPSISKTKDVPKIWKSSPEDSDASSSTSEESVCDVKQRGRLSAPVTQRSSSKECQKQTPSKSECKDQ